MDAKRGKDGRRRELLPLLTANEKHGRAESTDTDVVFDFTGLHRPGFSDLSLILTARLQSEPSDRVWVRALPRATWDILSALGLDHLFRAIPGTGGRIH